MNTTTVAIGAAAAIFGLSTIFLRHTHPQWFKKFGPMKEKFGETAGYIVHFIGYSLVPIIFGVTMIIHGMNGGSIIDR